MVDKKLRGVLAQVRLDRTSFRVIFCDREKRKFSIDE